MLGNSEKDNNMVNGRNNRYIFDNDSEQAHFTTTAEYLEIAILFVNKLIWSISRRCDFE